MKDNLSSYFEDPEFKEALAKYENMVENHTSAYFEADELTDIAEYYSSKGENDEAEKVIDFVLKMYPGNTDALVLRARSLVVKGELEEAHQVLALIGDSDEREVKFLQADLLIEENQIAEADKVLDQLASNEDEDTDTILDIILTYVDANQESYADQWYARLNERQDVAQLASTNQRFRDALSDYFMTFNHPEQAISYLQISLDEYPYSIKHWISLGSCQLQLLNFEEAHEALDFALAIDEENEEAIALKAICYRQSGNMETAATYYLKLSEIGDNKARAYIALAKLYLDMHNFKLATEYLETILFEEISTLSNYELAELYCDVAICHASLEDIDQAKEYIRRALALNGQEPEICIAAGRVFLTGNDNESAMKEFERALALTPPDEHYDTLVAIATACFDIPNYRVAVHYFEQINEKYPALAKPNYFFLLYSYFYLEQVTECMHYLAKIKTELPDLYDNLEDYSLSPDQKFDTLIHELKKGISNGKIDLNHYL